MVALDDTIYDYLKNWVPDHVVRPPPGFDASGVQRFATPGSPGHRLVSRVRAAALTGLLDQARHFLLNGIIPNFTFCGVPEIPFCSHNLSFLNFYCFIFELVGELILWPPSSAQI